MRRVEIESMQFVHGRLGDGPKLSLLCLEVVVPGGDGGIGRQVKVDRLQAENASDETQIRNRQVL